ncbi:ABC transporter substrate-binding protein [Ignavibacterium album]|uniref:ABC transporter substrate-binding protein n=1 Tax=Ignavibacterium album TaxID=591197 RepID=UPI00143C14C0|nr:ABC transporter substrate-binding protein [Ignavibacterium album]
MKFYFSVLLVLLISTSCEKEEINKASRVIISIQSEPETLNPIYAFGINEGVITDHLFLYLLDLKWNENKGDVEAFPMLAKNWQWNSDSTSVDIYLRNDAKWSDGKTISAYDVIYSFEVYSDQKVQSRFYGMFKNFYHFENGEVDPEKTFAVKDSFHLIINFLPDKVISLFDLAFPIIPKHIYEKLNRSEIQTAGINFNPVTSGPYKLKKWERNQFIILEADKNSFLYDKNMIAEVIFKIIPDYNSMLTQLKKGEIDFAEDIRPSDAKQLGNQKNLKLASVKGRQYDYVGWNNIDGKYFSETKKIKPNKFFGDKKVRQALSYAINRKEILDQFLSGFGSLCNSPISEIFVNEYDSSLKGFEYNPEKAKELLKESGWTDKDKNGIIEKDKTEFSFTLNIPSGNPLREFAATVIKNNFKQVGIDVRIEKLEFGVLMDALLNRKIDAWIIAWFIALPIDLKSYWYSDLNQTQMNFVGYQSIEADKVILELEKKHSYKDYINLMKRFQRIISEDQPVTFLYWFDNVVCYNKRIKNITINPFGPIQRIWEWRLEN